jgi:hypothetical protein
MLPRDGAMTIARRLDGETPGSSFWDHTRRRLITLHRAMQGLSRCNSKLSRLAADRVGGQTNTLFCFDQLSHHLSRPKRFQRRVVQLASIVFSQTRGE